MTPYTAERAEPVMVAEMTAEGMDRDAAEPEYWDSADGLPYCYTLDRPNSETDRRSTCARAGSSSSSWLRLARTCSRPVTSAAITARRTTLFVLLADSPNDSCRPQKLMSTAVMLGPASCKAAAGRLQVLR